MVSWRRSASLLTGSGGVGEVGVVDLSGESSISAPQPPQKRSPGSLAKSHFRQTRSRTAPHSPQNFRPVLFSASHFEQCISQLPPETEDYLISHNCDSQPLPLEQAVLYTFLVTGFIIYLCRADRCLKGKSLPELFLGYLAGLLTLVNPCVLPVLPIVLVSSLQADRRGPFALAAGLSLSFVVLGLFVIVLGASVGIDQRWMTTAGAWLMVGFGIVLMVPRFSDAFAAATAGFAGRANERLMEDDMSGRTSGLGGQFLGGVMLGAVWSPCIGPTLGGAISLASQGKDIVWAGAIMASFALGVSSIVIVLAFGTREALIRRKKTLGVLAERAKPLLGITFLCVGAAILFGFDHWLEGQLLDILPLWLQDFSVSL